MHFAALDPLNIPLVICAGFYAVLCVFSIVAGAIYLTGRRQLNPLELSDSFVKRLEDGNKLESFARFMGGVTFVVGLAQGLTAFAILRGGSPVLYGIALGFTLFSIASVAFKLRGKVNAFPLLKLGAYLAILVVLLLSSTQTLFF